MAKDKLILALDIGTSLIRAVAGSISNDGHFRVEAMVTKPSEGVKSGSNINTDQIHDIITSIQNDVLVDAGYEVGPVILSIGGSHIKAIPSTGLVAINAREKGVSEGDIDAVRRSARNKELPHGYEIINSLVQDFIIDSRAGIKRPLGITGQRLESKMLLVCGDSNIIKNLKQGVTYGGLNPEKVIFQALADSDVCLTEEEKETGVLLINIGAGSTNMIAFQNGAPTFVGGVDIGSDSITNDIATILKIPKSVAESVKCDSGSCFTAAVDPEDYIDIPKVGGLPPIAMSRFRVADICEYRMIELFNLIQDQLEKTESRFAFNLVVLVGGGAKLSGVAELAREYFGCDAKIGIPQNTEGLDGEYYDPRFSTVLGLMKGQAKSRAGGFLKKEKSKSGGLGNAIKRLFGKYF